MNLIEMAEAGILPDPLVRAGICNLLRPIPQEAARLEPDALADRVRDLLTEMRNSPIAVATDDANTQHYEVPSAFFEQILGPRLKYSACFWPTRNATLPDAEQAMLTLYAERAQLEDGQSILDLGCGWGSFALWAAERYPKATITAISNSRTQANFIRARATALRINNLEVITANARDLALDGTFDRVVSVEMFEHMRNWEALLERVSACLNPGGKLFLHIFVHRCIPYIFNTERPTDWMGREFFTGGMMPSDDLVLNLQRDLVLEDRWRINGKHYATTLRAWLVNLDRRREQLLELFARSPRAGRSPKVELQRWRLFLMACEELFAYRGGWEWYVAHYRLVRR